MRIADFDFNLPAESIAQQPAEPRDAARMLVLERDNGAWRDLMFRDFALLLNEGDTLVVNNTRVFPARLVGEQAESGGKIELFLVREISAGESPVWETLARPGKRLRKGARVLFGASRLRAEVVGVLDDTGRRLVRFELDNKPETDARAFEQLVDEIGLTPLPPYIKRDTKSTAAPTDDTENETDAAAATDRLRYQTIYAKQRGAIAAPTAGLHITAATLDALSKRGVYVAEITLHVGYGTFAPIRAEDLSEHSVAAERFEITKATAATINERRTRGGRTIAVGTTSVRALETAVDADGHIRATSNFVETDLTITPGYDFKAVDALLTNFHLPRSSLLVLVAAFAGTDLTLAAYSHAVQSQYRFYSYGDCMLIV